VNAKLRVANVIWDVDVATITRTGTGTGIGTLLNVDWIDWLEECSRMSAQWPLGEMRGWGAGVYAAENSNDAVTAMRTATAIEIARV